ncbi:MAG: hypothetical protein WBQ25_26080 [Nitrososphaeraceae archaeon]
MKGVKDEVKKLLTDISNMKLVEMELPEKDKRVNLKTEMGKL